MRTHRSVPRGLGSLRGLGGLRGLLRLARRVLCRRTTVTAGLTALVLLSGATTFLYVTIDIPPPHEAALAQATVVYYSDGRTELGRIGPLNRTAVPLAQIPENLQKAVLAAEDRQFYAHGGFSLPGIARAAAHDVTGGASQGGSTITQQLVKNYFLTGDHTMWRKVSELVVAVKLERQYTKQQILETYLNTIFFGRGAYGVEAAARAYFGVPARALTLGQAALLASVIESPAGLAPEHHAARLRARWNVVLDAMSAEGWITRPARTAVTFPSVVARSNAGAPSGPSGFLLAFVEQELDHRFGYSLEALGRLHLTVVTTFEASAQARAVRAVTAGRPSNRAVHVGVLSLDPRTGGIVAMFGGGAYAQPQFLNDATQVTAEVGHTLDGFTLAAALEGGLHVDGVWDAANGRLYDDGGRSLHRVPATGSPITLGAAVAFEKNAVVRTVEHLRQVGTTRVLGLARAAGASASVTLPRGSTADAGSVAATALDLATAYGTLVDDGMVARPTSVARIDDPDATVYRLAPERTRAVPAAVAQAVSAVLRTGPVVEPPPGTPLPSFGRPVVRVATTSGRRSSWFIGCTPELATAVVLVRPDPRGGPAHAMTPADLAATGNPLGRAAQIGVEVMAGR